MERLTKRTKAGTANIDYDGCTFPNGKEDYIAKSARRQLAIERFAAIEDILGDEYDLDRLRELAQADREGRVEIIEPDVYECVKTVRKAQAALRREQE